MDSLPFHIEGSSGSGLQHPLPQGPGSMFPHPQLAAGVEERTEARLNPMTVCIYAKFSLFIIYITMGLGKGTM